MLAVLVNLNSNITLLLSCVNVGGLTVLSMYEGGVPFKEKSVANKV
jgi:hypothetical protein